ncbi:hypothetical protein R50073_43220 [Maricurvus nonylphenolicus]|uniref:putative bifunctional diguanylate cyclase/phosphodiesterase n=1 Tax=Maricurvus nonylphenolicus TaxID=1008307 RepID=UPI0036F3C961
MIDSKVRAIVSSLSSTRGEDFFNTIVQALSQAIDAEHTYVAELSDDYSVATTVAYAHDQEICENFSYELADTPCANVCEDSICVYNGDAQAAYPKDELLVEMGVDSYVGAPLKDSKGQVQGILIALFSAPLEDIHSVESLFLLFSGLISGELERRNTQGHLNIKEMMVDALEEGVVLTDQYSRIIYVNPAFTRITGYSLSEATGQTPGSLLKSGLHDDDFYRAMWHNLNADGFWSGEILNRKKSGETYTEWLSIQRFTEPESNSNHYIAVFHDISDLKQAQQKVQLHEHYDLLTNLPNRQLLLERIEQQLLLLQQQDRKAAVMLISIDNFRDLNSSMGHHVGDLILQKVARRLETNLRQTDTLARYAGDEFVLLLPMLEDITTVETVAAKVLDAIRAPFMIEQSPIEITASIGIAVCPDDANETLTAIAKADQACNHAKASGKNTSQFFTEEMQQRSNYKMYLKNALTKALQEGALEVYYQPIVDLHNRQIEKCEALVRWQHEGKFISPMEFIPVAEEFQLAKDLGQLVLEKTCRQLQALDNAQCRPITIAVNRSVAEFPKAKRSHEDWLEIIREQGINADRISFEITESILAPENSEFTDYLSTLKKAGCTISLDDFGTGYSSLSYLRTFPIDNLKIDRSFVSDLEEDEEALTLVSTIIAMAKALGMKTIAEGVETRGQLQLLEELGCDYIQGFFFSRPLPEDKLVDYLQAFDYDFYL